MNLDFFYLKYVENKQYMWYIIVRKAIAKDGVFRIIRESMVGENRL